MDHRPLTSNHVLTALAILGCPQTRQYVATDRHLPLLLGALLNVVENEIADQTTDPDRRERVLDGYLAQSNPGSDLVRRLSLAAHRLDRTTTDLDRSVGAVAPPAAQMLDVVRQANRCAGLAVTMHQTAAAAGYRSSDERLRTGLLALGNGIAEMINRFNEMVAHLDQSQPAG
jgi:hypothetical protein